LRLLWRGFWQVADPKIWIASTVPMAVGGALAYGLTGRFSGYWFAVCLFGVYLIEIGKNAANDLVDYQSGVDLLVADDKRTPFSGGKRAIVEGHLSLSQAAWITALTLGAGAAAGIYIAVYREPGVIWVGLLGIFFAAAYSLPPFKLAYRGLGEMVVGVTFGPLIVSGMFIVQAGYLAAEALLASLPIGFLIANVLYINQYPDYEADLQGNKRNWVVRLGRIRGLRVYKALFAAAFISVIILSVTTKNLWWLLAFAALPTAWNAVKTAELHYEDIPLLLPANAGTIFTYQIAGAAMVLAGILTRFHFN
jgi:1,4-dihydroxy-2-naphthoate polyprenyltransferase